MLTVGGGEGGGGGGENWNPRYPTATETVPIGSIASLLNRLRVIIHNNRAARSSDIMPLIEINKKPYSIRGALSSAALRHTRVCLGALPSQAGAVALPLPVCSYAVLCPHPFVAVVLNVRARNRFKARSCSQSNRFNSLVVPAIDSTARSCSKSIEQCARARH
jgi:hypothetical protein